MPQHRGRWQAQGAGLQESESWSRVAALPAKDGQILLTALETKLTGAERQIRQIPFAQARAFVERVRQKGGLGGTAYKRSFLVQGDNQARRVDLEIHAGWAFVP